MHGMSKKIDVKTKPRAVLRLQKEITKVKKILSINPEAMLNIECLMDDQDVSTKITREKFEELSAHLLQDIIDTLEADGNAYAKKLTLYYQLKANDKLLAKLVDDGAAVPTLTRAGASDAALAVGGAKHSREVTSPKQKQQQARRMSSSPARK